MTSFKRLRVDWRVILFFILLILLPFILLSSPNSSVKENSFFLLIEDTIPEFVVVTSPDTLREDFPAIFSSLTLALDSIPADTVSVTAIPDIQLNLGLGAGVPITLIFPPYAAALNAQEIKVKPVDDDVHEDWHYGNITFSIDAAGSGFDDLIIEDLTYLIEDNDPMPGINSVIDIDTFFTEGLPGINLLFSLNSIPTDTVIITIDPDEQLRISGIPGEAVDLIFLPNASCLSLDGVNIRAVDDAIYEGDHFGSIEFTITTSDTIYQDFVLSDLVYTIYDNDSVPGINAVINTDTFLTEGLTGVILLFALKTIPSDTVYITVDPDEQMRITGVPDEPVVLIFAPNASALSFESVSLRAYDDAIYEGLHSGTLQFTIESSDPDYASLLLEDVIYPIYDNDFEPAIIFSIPDVLELTEGIGEIAVSIALASVPTDTVFIEVIPDLQLRITGAPGESVTLIFAPNITALTPHIANIKAYDDLLYEELHSGNVSFEIITADIQYASFSIDPFDITIIDNDLPQGIMIEDTVGLAGTEGDSILFFSVVLTSIPAYTVTINFDPDDQLDLGKGRDNDINLKFKGDSALITQFVDVFIFDDPFYEGLHLGTIVCSITSSDSTYSAFTIPDIIVQITDNDPVSIVEHDLEIFNVFPSLSTGTIHVNIPFATEHELFIFNSLGHLVKTISNVGNYSIFNIDHLPAGYYTITTTIEETAYYCRITLL